MAEESLPPSPAFTGIDFNPSFFPSATSEYVEFPNAQGTVTFGEIFVTDIDTPTPSVDFDFLSSEIGNINIGTSVPTTKTIKIGASTGTSIHCASINCTGTNINNAVAATTGDISLCNNQTTGILNIGTGSRTLGGSGGGINIGSLATGAIPIVIGTTGQTTTALNGTSVNVGTKLTAPKIDSTTLSTAMTIGENLTTGQLSIAQNQQTGLLNIGVCNSRSTTSGNINIGTGASVSSAINIGGGDSSSGSINIGQIGTTTGTTTVNIGTSTVGSHPVNIGSTSALTTINGASTLSGAVAASIGIKTPYIEPATATSDLDLAAAQTSGDLYIGTGTRTSAADINIGTGANGAGNIFIGHKPSVVSTQAVKINTSSATGASGATTIGSTTSATTIGGSLSVSGMLTADGGITLPSGDTLTVTGTISGTGAISTTGLMTANGGLTMGGSNHITLTTATGTVPAVNQLGYAVVKGPTTATVTSTSTPLVFANFLSGANGTGTYIVTYTVNTTGAWAGLTSGYITFSYSQSGTASVAMLGTPPLLSYSTGLNGESWVVIVQVTDNGPGIQLNAITNAVGNSVAVTSSAVFTKIA